MNEPTRTHMIEHRPTSWTNPPRVLVTRTNLPGVDRLHDEDGIDVVTLPLEGPDRDALRAAVADADAVLAVGNDALDADLFEAGRRLRVVGLASMGYDSLDVDAARAAGVLVSHTPGVLTETTADLAFSLVLMARRRLVEASDDMRAGNWGGFRMDGYLGLDVHGARMGILGYGAIGKAVGRRASGFGMRVQHLARASAPSDAVSSAVDMDTLLSTSDVLVLAAPLTPATRHIVDADALARMRPTATLVNVGRGPLVDEAALLAALREGRLHSAGLDVFDGEPRTDPTDPVMATPGLVVLPHIGSATQATRSAMVRLAADNVLAALRGLPLPTPVPGTPASVQPERTGGAP